MAEKRGAFPSFYLTWTLWFISHSAYLHSNIIPLISCLYPRFFEGVPEVPQGCRVGNRGAARRSEVDSENMLRYPPLDTALVAITNFISLEQSLDCYVPCTLIIEFEFEEHVPQMKACRPSDLPRYGRDRAPSGLRAPRRGKKWPEFAGTQPQRPYFINNKTSTERD